MDLEDERERDSSSDHATIADEEELAERDGFPFATQSKRIESAQHSDYPEYDNDEELREDEGKAPPGRDGRVERDPDIRIDCRFEGISQERDSNGGSCFALG